MRTKGFTLVELLGVIVILAIILFLVYPTVTSIVSQSKETIYEKQINTILNAAYDFTLKQLSYLPENDNINYITLGQLKYEGVIDVNIQNPHTSKAFPDNLVISIQNVDTNHSSNDLSMLKGNYLYAVEMDKLNGSSSLLPQIILSLEGDKELIKNSDDNYLMTLNLNEDIPKVNVSATHSKTSSIVLDNKVIQYKLLNNVAVDEIKTSKPAIYKINYSVVNKDGYATLVILNVIIADTIPPTITFPETTVISKDDTYFDLLKGISCQDNSGFCDIEYTDTIEYGVVKTHTVTYTVKDPSGNTITKKRAITIE